MPTPFLTVRPYIIRMSAEHVTVEFKTVFAWMKWAPLLAIVSTLGSLALALVNGAVAFTLATGALFGLAVMAYVAYLAIVQRGYRPVNQGIRDAMRDGTAEFSGGAYSFARPLTVTLPLRHAERFLRLPVG
jgi:hypothetical protein